MEFNIDRLLDNNLEWNVEAFPEEAVNMGLPVTYKHTYTTSIGSCNVIVTEFEIFMDKVLQVIYCAGTANQTYITYFEYSEEYRSLKQVITRLQNKHKTEAMNPKLEYKVEVFETPYNREVLVNGVPIKKVDPVEIESIAHELVSDLDTKHLINLISKFSRKASTADLDEREVKSDIYRVTTLEL